MKVDNRIVFGVIGGAAIALFFLGRSCGVKSVIKEAGRIDTVYAKPDTLTFYVTTEKIKPVAVLKFKEGKTILDTTFIEKPPPTDTLGIVEDYYRTYVYSYSERIKYATISIEDTLSQNMFMGRSVTAVFDSIPVVTKTQLVLQPKKLIMYASLSALGNKNDLLYGFGGGLSLKGLNDKIYGVELKYLKGGSLYYEGKIMIPIRLKK